MSLLVQLAIECHRAPMELVTSPLTVMNNLRRVRASSAYFVFRPRWLLRIPQKCDRYSFGPYVADGRRCYVPRMF